MPNNTQKEWLDYVTNELAYFTPIIEKLGFSLNKEQPHVGGERYLMQAITTTSGRKLILIGEQKETGKKVVLKVSTDKSGMEEIKDDHTCWSVLEEIKFAYNIFFSPPQVLFLKTNKHVISIQEFVEQKCTFLERPVKEQFALALKAFKVQEGARATTYGHEQKIKKVFTSANAEYYLNCFNNFKKNISSNTKDTALVTLLDKSTEFLIKNKETIDQYSGFLTHTDFVPHNIRVVDDTIYLLDHSSLRFGNKYEGWARFLNFMTLYNPELEEGFLYYLKENRAPEELLSLKLMRLYRLGEIIWYYTRSLSQTEGDLHTLNTKRISFWKEVLKATLEDKIISGEIRELYKNERDQLRSSEEKKRQQNLH